jgi:multidrug efflux pump subunit AcrA (membrane-fusion protein)
MKKLKKIAIPVLILLAGFILMQVFLSMKEDAPKQKPEPRQKAANAVVVNLQSIQAEVVAYGRMASTQPVQLLSEVSGTLIRGDVAFLPGQRFRKGDTLIAVDSRQVDLDLNSSMSDFLNALASVLPEIKIDFPDEYKLWQDYFDECSFDGVLPELPAVVDRRIKMFLSRFNVYKLYFAVRNHEIRREKHFFVAPFNGSVLATELRPGSSVRNASLIGRIINLDNLEIEVQVPVDEVQWLERSSSVALHSSEMEGAWKGRITRIGASIDRRTQTVPVFIAVNSSSMYGLYDGIFLEARMPGATVENAFEIPRKAIYDEEYVYLIDNGILKYKRVTVRRMQNETAILTGGLSSGDTLVVDLMQGVAAGMSARAILSDQGDGKDS